MSDQKVMIWAGHTKTDRHFAIVVDNNYVRPATDLEVQQDADLRAVQAELDRWKIVATCEHTREMPDNDEQWTYIEHEGKTWQRCRRCDVLELWENGMFVRAILAPIGDTK
jgi:hypothetical protein